MRLQKIKRELLRAIRGKRSQEFLNRKLGFNFNQIYRWEKGYTEIDWIDFVRLTKACKISLEKALKGVLNFEDDPRQYDILIRRIIGDTKPAAIARTIDESQFRVRRWLKGIATPRLVDVLLLLDKISHLLLEFTDGLVGVDQLPSLKKRNEQKKLERSLHNEHPCIGALLHAIELDQYKNLPAHVEGFLSERIGIPIEEERNIIGKCLALGIVKFENSKLKASSLKTDLRGDFESFKRTRTYWLSRSLRYIENAKSPSREDFFGYLVFNVSKQAEKKLIEKYAEFFSEVRFIVESDEAPSERVRLMTIQFLDPSRV